MLLQPKGYPQAPRAPHAPQGAYPGTCRDLTDAERESRRAEIGRPPALRLRTDAITHTVHDLLHGDYTGIVDDFVVRRGDGVAGLQPRRRRRRRGAGRRPGGARRRPAGVVAAAGVPRQHCWAIAEPTYAHVALVLNEDGARLAKRDGAVTLAEIGVQRALAQIAESLGWQASSVDEMLDAVRPRQAAAATVDLPS